MDPGVLPTYIYNIGNSEVNTQVLPTVITGTARPGVIYRSPGKY